MRNTDMVHPPVALEEGSMQFEVVQSKDQPGEWRVEATNETGDGEVFVTIFSGPKAEERAREYAEWKNASGGARLKRVG